MPRPLLTIWLSLILLLTSPSLHLPNAGWTEVGVTPAAAAEPQVETKKVEKKKPVKKTRRMGSSGIVTSNQPGFHPMRVITPPAAPEITGTIVTPARDPRYPNVPTVPALVPETSQDRVARCTHQGALGGLPPGQQGAYVHNCAF